MKILKKLSLLVALLVPLLLTSCGGGSSSCGLSGLAFGLVACTDGGKRESENRQLSKYVGEWESFFCSSVYNENGGRSWRETMKVTINSNGQADVAMGKEHYPNSTCIKPFAVVQTSASYAHMTWKSSTSYSNSGMTMNFDEVTFEIPSALQTIFGTDLSYTLGVNGVWKWCWSGTQFGVCWEDVYSEPKVMTTFNTIYDDRWFTTLKVVDGETINVVGDFKRK